MYRKLVLLFILVLDFYWFVYLSERPPFIEKGDLTNWFTLSIEIMLGLFVAIGVTVYFHKKQIMEKENKNRNALKQIFDRYVYVLEHVKFVEKNIIQYYRIITSTDKKINYPENIETTRRKCENSMKGLELSAKTLENSLILLAGELDHKIKSGLRFFLDVIDRDKILFDVESLDMEKLKGLIGTAEETKKRLTEYGPELMQNVELKFEELKDKIKKGGVSSTEIMDYVWKE